MNKIFKLLGYIPMMLFVLVACSPEDFDVANQNDIPEISEANPVVIVDQETNNVTFSLDNKEMYPIWTIDGKTTTLNGYVKNYPIAGTYEYTLKVGNRNGVSDGEYKGTFTINTTRYDFTPTINKLAGNGTKEWRIYAAKAGHLGCGPLGSAGTEWWSASENNKAATGLYDDRITFSTDYKYSYNPGEDGMLYINNGVTKHSERFGIDGDGDFNTPVSPMESTYSLDYDAATDVVSIKLPAGTLFPYMAGNSQYDTEYSFRILKVNNKTLELALDLPVENISWHYLLVNGEDEAVEEGFNPNNVNWCDVNSDLNLVKSANTIGAMTFWWADASWGQTADPEFSFADGVYSITCASTGGSEWMGQSSIHNISTDIKAGEFYDYSFVVEAESNNELALTFKVAEEGNDDKNASLYRKGIEVNKGRNVIRFAKIAAENDIKNAVIFFDLGAGSKEGEVYKFSDIIIQKHNPK